MLSSRGINSGSSPVCPPVRRTARGRPAPSTATCALVENPPSRPAHNHDQLARARNSCNSVGPPKPPHVESLVVEDGVRPRCVRSQRKGPARPGSQVRTSGRVDRGAGVRPIRRSCPPRRRGVVTTPTLAELTVGPLVAGQLPTVLGQQREHAPRQQVPRGRPHVPHVRLRPRTPCTPHSPEGRLTNHASRPTGQSAASQTRPGACAGTSPPCPHLRPPPNRRPVIHPLTSSHRCGGSGGLTLAT
jgi:hypothetical protein